MVRYRMFCMFKREIQTKVAKELLLCHTHVVNTSVIQVPQFEQHI